MMHDIYIEDEHGHKIPITTPMIESSDTTYPVVNWESIGNKPDFDNEEILDHLYHIRLNTDTKFAIVEKHRLETEFYWSIVGTQFWYDRCKEWIDHEVRNTIKRIEKDIEIKEYLKNEILSPLLGPIKGMIEYPLASSLEEYCYNSRSLLQDRND